MVGTGVSVRLRTLQRSNVDNYRFEAAHSEGLDGTRGDVAQLEHLVQCEPSSLHSNFGTFDLDMGTAFWKICFKKFATVSIKVSGDSCWAMLLASAFT